MRSPCVIRPKDNGKTMKPNKNKSSQFVEMIDMGLANGATMIAEIAAPNTAAGIMLKCLLRLIMMKVTASVNAEINANISPSQTPDCKPSPVTNITPVIPAMIAAHVDFGTFSLRMITDSSAAMSGVEASIMRTFATFV